MAIAHVENLRVSPFVEPFNLRLADGEAVAILGNSSSGKTRLLRAIAGLDPADGGRVSIGGDAVDSLPADRRGISMVFSELTLYPHLDVEGNIAFPMECLGVGADDRRDRIDDLATQLDLVAVLDRSPRELTGPQRVRAALARALARRPRLLLVDDALRHLPTVDRQRTARLFRRIQRSMRMTTIYATEDFADAMSLADRIAFVAGGRLHQTDTPGNLYDNPSTADVARGLGSPPINLLDGHLEGTTLRLGEQCIELAKPPQDAIEGLRECAIGVRPEAFDPMGDRRNAIQAIVDPSSRQSLGSYSIAAGQVGEEIVYVRVPGNPADFPRRAYAGPKDLLLFDRADGRRLR